MSPIGLLLWVGVLCSLSVYAYRLWRRVTQGPKAVREARNADGADQPDATATPGTATFLIQNPIVPTDGVEATPVAPPPQTVLPVPEPTPAPREPLLQPPLQAPSQAPPPVPPPAPAPPLPDAERRGSRVPIAEAVTGIVLPCELTPIVSEDLRIDPYDISFATSTFDVDRVQAALVGELVRLGFAVTPTTAHRLVASRPDAELTLSLTDDPASVTREGRPLYPSVPAESVVVRFTS